MTSRRSLVAGSAASIAAVGLGSIPARCAGKMYPGTRVQDLSLGGMSRAEGARALRDALADFAARPVTLVHGDRAWTPTLDDLGVSIDYDGMLDDAMRRGRDEGALQRYTSFLSDDTDRPVDFSYTLDEERLSTWLKGLAGEIEVPAKNARLVTDDGSIVVVDHEVGLSLDTDRTEREIIRAIRSGRARTIEMPTVDVQPDVAASDLEPAKERAWRLVSEPVVFTHEDVPYPIATDDLASALAIGDDGEAALDPDALAPRLQAIAAAVATPPRNVKLGWDGGLYVVEKDIDGTEADLDAMGELVQAAAEDSTRVEAIPMMRVPAPARADNLDTLGLESHLGMGSSSFAGSSVARAENVRVSARNISYKLIAPGETFSFNELLGPITEDHGYIAGTIIQGDWVASDIGGGVCQVSTTVFRAAVHAGFRFTEWNPHSWRLDFYELDGTPPGLDAAIYQPNTEWEPEQDLRFENPLDSWLLLQVLIDGDTVSAHFYGKNPGWSVELFPARISDPRPAGDPVERENPSLAPGERRLVQQEQPGYLVEIRRTITDAEGAIIADGDFVSDYVPQPEAWEVGPS